MKTPNPQGYTRDKTWELLRLAVRFAQPHWSYDETKKTGNGKRKRAAALLASI